MQSADVTGQALATGFLFTALVSSRLIPWVVLRNARKNR